MLELLRWKLMKRWTLGLCVCVQSVRTTVVQCTAATQTSSDVPVCESNVAQPSSEAVQPAVQSVGRGLDNGSGSSSVSGGDMTSTADPPVTVMFPLRDFFSPYLACHTCFTDGADSLRTTATHRCQQDVLVVQSKQMPTVWFRIRERINHAEFAGKYHMCNQKPNPAIGKRCPRGDNCTFAHNEVECLLWTAERSGEFSIRQFVLQMGSKSAVTARHTIQSVLAKHPGHLALLCQDCFVYSHRVSMQSPTNPALCSVEAHDWSSSAVLAHRSVDAGNIMLIRQFPSTAVTTDYTLCLMAGFCRHRWKGECRHAHSVVERDLWCLQRDSGITYQQIMQHVSTTLCILSLSVCLFLKYFDTVDSAYMHGLGATGWRACKRSVHLTVVGLGLHDVACTRNTVTVLKLFTICIV